MNDIYSKGIGGRKVLILTSADRAEGICQNIQVNNSWNIKIVGIVLADEQEKKEIAGIPVVCEYSNMMEYIRRNMVDEVFYTCPLRRIFRSIRLSKNWK